MTEIIGGWRKDPRIHNETYHVRKLVRLPSSANNSDLLPLPTDQDGIGMCVGCAGSELCHTEGVKDGMIAKKAPLAFSPWWMYNGARYYEGKLNIDWGCFPNDAFRWLEEHGFLDWALWPVKFEPMSNIVKFDTTDPNTKDDLAIHYPKFKKMRIEDGNKGIMDALSSRYCVAIGMPWPSNWFSGSSLVQPAINKDTKMSGGHEVLIYAYTDDGYYEAMNSWGKNWGQLIPFLGTKGGFKFRMEDIDVLKEYFGGYDAHRIDVDMTPYLPPEPPVPPDPPKPKPLCPCNKMSDVLKVWRGR
jgi:hypothetical protein